MTNLVAFSTMIVNMTFYLWANQVIQTNQIQMMISFFDIAFPAGDEKGLEDDDADNERDLDIENGEDEAFMTKAEIQAKYNRQSAAAAAGSMFSEQQTRATEETRLTCQSGSSFNGKGGAFYYTGSFEGQDENGEESKSFGRMLDCGNSNTSHSEPFQLDDSVMDFILKEDNNESGSTQ